MQIIAYLRVSSDRQDVEKQKYEILQYANKKGLIITEFIIVEISTKKNLEKRRINELLEKLNAGDILISTELSRIGRSMIEVLLTIDQVLKKGASVVFTKQPELSAEKSSPFHSLMVANYGYMCETERLWNSQRTKEALKAAKAKGVKLGRKPGSLASRLDPYKAQIIDSLNKHIPRKYIAAELKVTPQGLSDWINSRLGGRKKKKETG